MAVKEKTSFFLPLLQDKIDFEMGGITTTECLPTGWSKSWDEFQVGPA